MTDHHDVKPENVSDLSVLPADYADHPDVRREQFVADLDLAQKEIERLQREKDDVLDARAADLKYLGALLDVPEHERSQPGVMAGALRVANDLSTLRARVGEVERENGWENRCLADRASAWSQVFDALLVVVPDFYRLAPSVIESALTAIRGLGEQLAALQAKLSEAEAEHERLSTKASHLEQNAACQAQEARTQRAIVLEILHDHGLPLRDWEARGAVAGLVADLRAKLSAAAGELDLLKTCGIIEVAVRNPNVASYTEHWEGRATKAEARITRVEALVGEWRGTFWGEQLAAALSTPPADGEVPPCAKGQPCSCDTPPADQQEGDGLIEDHEFMKHPHADCCIRHYSGESAKKALVTCWRCKQPASRHRGTKEGR